MAKLPSVTDLGPTPSALPQRAIGDISSGVDAMAAGGRALGQGIIQAGQGIRQLGQDEAHLQFAKQRWERSTSEAQLVSGLVDLGDTTKKDTNPGPDDSGTSLVNRHAEQAWKLQTDAAANIADPAGRQHFLETTNPQVQRSISVARLHATGLENNQAAAWTDERGTDAINKGIAAPDDATRRDLIDTQNGLIDGLVTRGVYTPVQGLAKKREFAKQFVTADYLHRADADPQGVINEVQPAPSEGDDVTNRIIRVEGTGKNPGSSADGVGQFIDSTWGSMLRKYHPEIAQGRSDAELSAFKADKNLAREMTDAYRQENVGYLQKQGAPVTPGAQYLAHFLGPGGAAAVLKADPGQPVQDVLTQAVGAKQAQAMIDANPSVLKGQLAGSVAKWADGKMGGVAPGGGGMAQFLDPVTRETIISRAQSTIDKQQVTGRALFETQVRNAEQEALDTGSVSKPLTLGDFVGRYGAQDGPIKYQAYDVSVQTGRAISAMATMSALDRAAVVDSLAPKPGDPNYAIKANAYEVARKASASVDAGFKVDPAGYAAAKLPASKDAYRSFQDVAANPTVPFADRAAAAQHFAAVTLADQAKAGVPAVEQRILPKGYVTNLNAKLNNPAAVGGAGNVAALIDNEAKLWGSAWPQVQHQLAGDKATSSLVRVVSTGIDPVAAGILVENKDLSPQAVLKDQSTEKWSTVQTAVQTAIKPFADSLMGQDGGDRVFHDFEGAAQKLTAHYVAQGADATKAAERAFEQLLGRSYDFSGKTYRIPKDAGVSSAAIASGLDAAKASLRDLGVNPAKDTFGGLSADMLSRARPEQLARDGVWVTAGDREHADKGVWLVYQDQVVRGRDGKTPLFLSWQQLADMGKSKPAAAPQIDTHAAGWGQPPTKEELAAIDADLAQRDEKTRARIEADAAVMKRGSETMAALASPEGRDRIAQISDEAARQRRLEYLDHREAQLKATAGARRKSAMSAELADIASERSTLVAQKAGVNKRAGLPEP